MVSTTVKDCSVLLAFAIVRGHGPPVVECSSGGRNVGVLTPADLVALAQEDAFSPVVLPTTPSPPFHVVYSAHVVDIDAKDVFKIPTYHAMEEQVLRAFVRNPRAHVCHV